MATHIKQWIEKATFDTTDIQGAGDGGFLSPAQAQVFLRDAIEATEILQRGDVFDSGAPLFEVPKISFATRIMRAGTQGSRLADADRVEPDTGLVTLTTQLFKGEVPVTDEVFEDNVERNGLADTLMGMISEAVGRDLEQIAIQSKDADADATFGLQDGIVQQLIVSATANELDLNASTTMRQVFAQLIDGLPSRYRRNWSQYKLYVSPNKADAYAEELADRGTALGDSNITDKQNLRYRSIEVVEVPLLTGTQDAVNYDNFVILSVPSNLKVGFHRRVRVEKYRDPREGLTSFLPSVRFDYKWAQDSAVVIGTNVDFV